MKKLLTLLLAVAMLATMAISASGADAALVDKADNQEIDVNATYVPGDTAQTVYSVSIAWGSMEFTYTGASDGTWNPETHAYDGATEAGWSCEDGANKISVTNHSNAAVLVVPSYSLNEGITGDFVDIANATVADIDLPSAEGTAVDAAPKADIYFDITGGSVDATGKIGTITITLQ